MLLPSQANTHEQLEARSTTSTSHILSLHFFPSDTVQVCYNTRLSHVITCFLVINISQSFKASLVSGQESTSCELGNVSTSKYEHIVLQNKILLVKTYDLVKEKHCICGYILSYACLLSSSLG